MSTTFQVQGEFYANFFVIPVLSLTGPPFSNTPRSDRTPRSGGRFF